MCVCVCALCVCDDRWEPAENLVGAADEALRLYHEKKQKAKPKPKKEKLEEGADGAADGEAADDGE